MLGAALALAAVLSMVVAGSVLLARHVVRRRRFRDKYDRYGASRRVASRSNHWRIQPVMMGGAKQVSK